MQNLLDNVIDPSEQLGIMQPMPSDFTGIRHKDDKFKGQQASVYIIQKRQRLSWVAHSRNIYLQTQYNGREMTLGKRRLQING